MPSTKIFHFARVYVSVSESLAPTSRSWSLSDVNETTLLRIGLFECFLNSETTLLLRTFRKNFGKPSGCYRISVLTDFAS